MYRKIGVRGKEPSGTSLLRSSKAPHARGEIGTGACVCARTCVRAKTTTLPRENEDNRRNVLSRGNGNEGERKGGRKGIPSSPIFPIQDKPQDLSIKSKMLLISSITLQGSIPQIPQSL